MSTIRSADGLVRSDSAFVGLPWLLHGRTRAGVDCVGLARLWLTEIRYLKLPAGPVTEGAHAGIAEEILQRHGKPGPQDRGDIVLFRNHATGRLAHVAIYLGRGRLLHIVHGHTSRIDPGYELLRRMGLRPAGAIAATDAELVWKVLGDPGLGWVQVALIVISIALSFASQALSRPNLSKLRNQTGRYGFDALITRSDSALPIPETYGSVMVAGNSPYTSVIDKTQTVTDATLQKATKVVILGGPLNDIVSDGIETRINNILWSNGSHFTGTALGFEQDPVQDFDNAVDGTIGSDSNRPSFSVYDGWPDIEVPVDVRAQWDRGMPVYGFSGCSYMVFRLIDSTKFPSFNLNCPVKGRYVRFFNGAGFAVDTYTAEPLAGADGSKTRFKLPVADIYQVSEVLVDGDPFVEMDEDNQTGDVYSLNRTKGYIEFPTAPGGGAVITISFVYYLNSWSRNPVRQLVHLLTDPVQGAGIDPGRIDWESAALARAYCDEEVRWTHGAGAYTGPRWTGNYSVDFRRPIEEHVRAMLDSFYGFLFQSGDKIVIKARREADSVFDFDTSNILTGSFRSEQVDRAEKGNRIRVFYQGLEALNTETSAIRDDRANQEERESRIGNDGVVEESLRVLSIDNQGQAERFGEVVLRENMRTDWLCEFTTSITGLALEPGDVVSVTHPSQPTWDAKLFRIEDLSMDAEDRIHIRCSEYSAAAYF